MDERLPSRNEILYDFRTYPQPSVFWTRDLWEMAGPLDEGLYFAMDHALWARMQGCHPRPIRVPAVLSIARSHPEQRSAGGEELLAEQRTYAALEAARARGGPGVVFALRVWLRRAVRALRTGRLGHLRHGSHNMVMHLAVTGRYRYHRPGIGRGG